MAGIVGIYCADGRPADVAELKRMAEGVEYRGPDGIRYWNSGSVAFAHLQFCTTPESIDERQPLLSSSGDICLVWNGRLDNREELIEALVARREHPPDRTDPGLVLSAYLLWGTECVQHLIGDFALAVWDARLRHLWCARDYIGVRSFYYYWDGKTFLFAPELCGLLAHPLVSPKINEGMVGEYLVNGITHREETLYADIRRLPAGSTLTLDASGDLRTALWWSPEFGLLEYRTDDEYADHFRYLMEQSVLSKIRCHIPWSVPLSGGLDSSTISVTAQGLLNQTGSQGRRVSTLSLAMPGRPWDESEYIAETAQFAGLQSECFPLMRKDEEYYRQQAARTRDFPDYPNGSPIFVPMCEVAKRQGIRVFLNGVGGNEWLDGRPLDIADLIAGVFRTHAVRKSLRLAIDDLNNERGTSQWAPFLFRKTLIAALPAGARAFRRRIRLTRHSIFSQEFLKRTRLADRLYKQQERGGHRFASPDQESVFLNAISGREVHMLEIIDRDSARAGFEDRYPFFDRRLAEFCLRLPREQRQRGEMWKWVLRQAMRGRLPERVRTRVIQAEFSELFEVILYDPWARARLANLTIQKRTDWLDPVRFAKKMILPEPPPLGPYAGFWPIWMVLGIDLWLESVFSAGGGL